MRNLNRFTDYINVPKIICEHVLGKKHSKLHRRGCGFMIMIIGVCIADLLGAHSGHYGSVMCNLVGYGLHGAGLLPFIEEDE